MTKAKKLVSAVVAAASIGAIGVTASAATNLPTNWQALYQHGAPTSINKEYVYTVKRSESGYIAECKNFSGGNGSVVTLTTSNSYGTYKYTMKGSYDFSSSTAPVTFTFSALGSSANTNASGSIDAQ